MIFYREKEATPCSIQSLNHVPFLLYVLQKNICFFTHSSCDPKESASKIETPQNSCSNKTHCKKSLRTETLSSTRVSFSCVQGVHGGNLLRKIFQRFQGYCGKKKGKESVCRGCNKVSSLIYVLYVGYCICFSLENFSRDQLGPRGFSIELKMFLFGFSLHYQIFYHAFIAFLILLIYRFGICRTKVE